MKSKIKKDKSSSNSLGSFKNFYRSQKLNFASMSWRTRGLVLSFVTVAFAIFSALTHFNLFVGAAIGFGLCLTFASLLMVGDVLKIIFVLLAYATISAPLGALYSTMAQRSSKAATIDYIGGALALFISMLLSVWVATRFSRGKPWITLLLVGISTIFPGVLFLYIFPSLGLNIARLMMATVLLFRCGGWAWISGAFGLLMAGKEKEKEKEVRKISLEDVKALEAWDKRAKAEKATALELSSLSKEYKVFHDLKVKNSQHALGQLVVGPGGCSLIASLYSKGPLTENSKNGISLPDIPLDKSVGVLVSQREELAKTLACKEADLSLIVVIHGLLGVKELRKPMAFFTDNFDIPDGQVVLVTPDMLIQEVAPGLELWSNIKVKQVVNRAKMKLHPAMAPGVYRGLELDTPRVIPLDKDGHPTLDTKPSDLIPSWIAFGKPVHIYTTQGVLSDLRISGNPIRNSNGDMIIPICVEEEWNLAKSKGRRPVSYSYPLSSIIPA